MKAMSVAGRTVIPAIERSGDSVNVVLSVDVGSGRGDTPETIDGDAIDLQLIDAHGEPLPITARPAPGPLAVAGSRALYATAAFSFHAPIEPERMRVAIDGQSAEFPVSTARSRR